MTKLIRDNKIALYSAGFMIIMSTWLITCTAELSAYSLIKFSLLIIFSYAAMVFDISTRKIPNMLVLIMLSGWLLLLIPILFIIPDIGMGLFLDSLYGMLIGGGLFMLVYLLSSKGLGGGDVKFMAVAGLYLGFSNTVPAILYGTVLAALTGTILLIIKKIGRKDAIPLAPFLFIGIMITVFTP